MRTLWCDDGQTIVASFAGLEGSEGQGDPDERVLVYKWIRIDRPPVGVDGPNDDLNVRGLQGVPDERLVTCGYMTGSGNVVKASVSSRDGAEVVASAAVLLRSTTPPGRRD